MPGKPAAKPITTKPSTQKPSTQKPAAKAAPASKTPAVKPAVKPVSSKKPVAKKPAAKGVAPTAASSAAVDAYFAAQKPSDRALLERLRAIVLKAIPDAQPALKWGAPFYIRNGKNITSMAAFKEHVSINFFAPPEVLVDPTGRLEGEGKGNRALKVRTAADIDAVAITRWLKAAVAASA